MKLTNTCNKLKTRWKIGKHELTNTLLHAVVGAAFGLSGFIARTIPSLVIMIPIAMFIGTSGFELAQKDRAKTWNWLDSLIDVIAGNLGFHIVYWLIWWLI